MHPLTAARPRPLAAPVPGGRASCPSSFLLHGLRLDVQGVGPAAAAVRARLAGLPLAPAILPLEPAEAEAPLTFLLDEQGEGPPLERPSGGRPVYDPPVGEVLYDPGRDLLWAAAAGCRARCEPAAGRARLAGRAEAGEAWLLSHPLFTLCLVELAKRRGLFGLHAAGLCHAGRALVLPGTSGAGKSTLALALVRAGFGFLGDDTLFLSPESREPGGVRLLAFPDQFDLTDGAGIFFPELVPFLAAPRPAGCRKLPLRAERLYGAEVVRECAPALLVFPRIAAGEEESALEPMDPGEALLELAGNVLLTEPRSSQAHLDALAALVGASRCYRLATGRNLDGAVRLLRALAEGT